MSAPDITREALDHFAGLLDSGHLTLLLGAGASAAVGLPDWDEFAMRVAVGSGIVRTEDTARLMLARQDPTMVLEAARVAAGDRWVSLLGDALYQGTDPLAYDPSSLHLAAAGFLTNASSGSGSLATLNFDLLLELALLATGAAVVATSLDGEDLAPTPAVYHLHGLIDGAGSHDAIVSFRDYAELVASNEPWQLDYLRRAHEKGPLLIAGTSYRDPDIRQWMHQVMRDSKSPHHAVVSVVREGLRITREEFADVKEALLAQWRSIGLRAVPMQDLADVAQLIRELAVLDALDYQSPHDRAHRVLQQHSRRFAELQEPYTSTLDANAQQLTAAIGARVTHGTLWLADAMGEVVRWASQGRIYTRTANLKRVPSGHDSPWLAGEALGAERVLVKPAPLDAVHTRWPSILAIPIYADDGKHPVFATGVVTFGVGGDADELVGRQDQWAETVEGIGATWGTRLSEVAFIR